MLFLMVKISLSMSSWQEGHLSNYKKHIYIYILYELQVRQAQSSFVAGPPLETLVTLVRECLYTSSHGRPDASYTHSLCRLSLNKVDCGDKYGSPEFLQFVEHLAGRYVECLDRCSAEIPVSVTDPDILFTSWATETRAEVRHLIDLSLALVFGHQSVSSSTASLWAVPHSPDTSHCK